jgi:hypothetical protein
MLQKSWEDEQTRLNREVITLQRKSDSLPDEITKATREMKSEHERRMLQEKRASSKAQEDIKNKCQVRNDAPSFCISFNRVIYVLSLQDSRCFKMFIINNKERY